MRKHKEYKNLNLQTQFFLCLLSLLTVLPIQAGFDPQRDNDDWSRPLRQIFMPLKTQLEVIEPFLHVPRLGSNNLDDLVRMSAGDEKNFLQLIRASLLYQGGRKEWVFQEPFSPKSLNVHPDEQKWWGEVRVFSSDHFLWKPTYLNSHLPLFEYLLHTLTMAFHLMPQTDLFAQSQLIPTTSPKQDMQNAISLPIIQQTHEAQIIIGTLAAEDFFHRILKYDFFWKALIKEVSTHSESFEKKKRIWNHLQYVRNTPRAEYLLSVLKDHFPIEMWGTPDLISFAQDWTFKRLSSIPAKDLQSIIEKFQLNLIIKNSEGTEQTRSLVKSNWQPTCISVLK